MSQQGREERKKNFFKRVLKLVYIGSGGKCLKQDSCQCLLDTALSNVWALKSNYSPTPIVWDTFSHQNTQPAIFLFLKPDGTEPLPENCEGPDGILITDPIKTCRSPKVDLFCNEGSSRKREQTERETRGRQIKRQSVKD